VSSLFSKSAAQHDEVTADLVKELGKVRNRVQREYRRLKGLRTRNEEKDSVALAKRKRLLFLFVKDLSSGVSREVLSGKSQRDSRLSGKLDRVSWWRKWMAGLFVSLLDIGMLLYVYLFAMNQTQSRQQAWFFSFVMWLGFEIFLSSTALVLVLHLLIPLYVWSDVAEVKKKVLTDLIEFREKYLKMKRNDIRRGGENDIETGLSHDFNAAKYLFPSWRVASLFPEEIPESQLVLRFSTPWPKKRFGKEEGKVAKEYEDDAILTAATRILLYFLTSLLSYSSLVQDIFIQTTCNGTLGSLLVLLVQLWNVYPWLTVLVVLVLLLCVYGLGKYSLSGLAKKLEETEKAEKDGSATRHEDGQGPGPVATAAPSENASLISPNIAVSSVASHQNLAVIPPPHPSSLPENHCHLICIGEDDDDGISLNGMCIWESEESSSGDDRSIPRLPIEESNESEASGVVSGASSSSDVEVTVVRVKKLREKVSSSSLHSFIRGSWH
jgi:hypothetical protein